MHIFAKTELVRHAWDRRWLCPNIAHWYQAAIPVFEHTEMALIGIKRVRKAFPERCRDASQYVDQPHFRWVQDLRTSAPSQFQGKAFGGGKFPSRGSMPPEVS